MQDKITNALRKQNVSRKVVISAQKLSEETPTDSKQRILRIS